MMERSKYMSIPKVRFHGFKEKWREESLSKLFVERHEISTITESLPQLSFTISEGVIYPNDRKSNKRDFLIKDITNKKYLVTYVGDIIYNPANVIYGAIHRNSLCNGVVSPIYKIFKTEQDSNFMECVVRNLSFISQLSMKTEGTVTKLKTLKPESFLEMIVKIAPSIDEQQKIASYFQSLDSLIQTTSKKLASLNLIKAASLQSMFPQEGETVPKVRFKGFKGEWDNDFISNVCKITTGKSNTQDQVKNGLYPFFIRSENIARSNKYLYDCEAVITIGDGNIGRVFHYINGKFDLHQRCYMMRNFRNVSALYFYYYFSAFFYDRAIKMSAKATVDSVRLNMIADMNILYPKNKLEQQKIASYFCNLDKQISLQTQRLEKLKQIKAACLDKMFV